MKKSAMSNLLIFSMKNKQLLTAYYLLFTILGSVLFYPGHSLAAIGISVAPVKYKFEVDPGQVVESSIVVSNPNEFSIEVRPEFQDFKVTENNNIQWLPSDIENPYKMSDWIKISQDTISLKPEEDFSIPFKIQVPKNATAGGRYAAIFFTGVLESGEGNIGAVPRVGALIILNVKGELKKTGQLLKLKGPVFANNGPVDFIATFKNTGTTHYETRLNVSVKNIFWKSGEFKSQEKFVYPNINREFTATWEKKALFGIYIAKASVADGDGNIYGKTKVFIGFPYLYIIVLAGLALAAYYLKRWFKKKFKIVRV